jgi:hypothetical protein
MAGNEKDSFEIRVRTGWKDEETELLLNEVKKAEEKNLPLKAVFSRVADETGRKPNSIRNYYYMKVKEGGSGLDKRTVSFTPFSKSEIRRLIADVLRAQGDGESVRSCTLRLGGGDRHKMLRYQNKYRSLIKSARPLVEMVMADMDQDGEKYLSPYETQKASAVRENRYIPENVARTLMSADVDVKAFFKGLAKVAALAASTAHTEEELHLLEAQTETIRKENATLSASIRELNAKLKKEMERSVKAATLYQQLMKLNTSFPELKNVESLTGLGELLSDSQHSSVDAL